MQTINIGNKKIGRGFLPFIIAEMSGNHNQSLDTALEIVEKVADLGVQALKLQTYTADTMTLDLSAGEFSICDPLSPWQGKSLYDLYQKAYTPWEWHKPIFDKCHKLGLLVFSTPFDESAVEFLESMKVPCYKIASFEIVDLKLISRVASTRKPLFISTGMATVAEIREAVDTARSAGCRDIILLKCTSSYPATPNDSNLLTIPHLEKLFDCPVGLSDHTQGIGAAVASVALGASVIEKHLTLSRAAGGVDVDFSLEPEEMRQLSVEANRAWQALGNVHCGSTESEKKSSIFRRSLYVVKDMRAGEPFTSENLRSIRPGLGLPPKYLEMLLGRAVKQDVKKGTPVSWEMLA